MVGEGGQDLGNCLRGQTEFICLERDMTAEETETEDTPHMPKRGQKSPELDGDA